MAQLVKHLNLLDKILKCFPSHVAFAKLLNCDFSAHPTSFKNITVATSANKVSFCIDLKIFKLDVKVKAVLSKRCQQASILP